MKLLRNTRFVLSSLLTLGLLQLGGDSGSTQSLTLRGDYTLGELLVKFRADHSKTREQFAQFGMEPIRDFSTVGWQHVRLPQGAYGDLAGAPVPVRFSEFLPDTRQIGQGVIVGQTGWEQALENNKNAFVADFVSRSPFINAHPTSLSPDQFVGALFLNAGVTPSPEDRQAAISEFGPATTTNDMAARARVLRRVAEHATLAQQEFNKAFVLMQYFGYLRRNPNDAPDTDFTGYNFWLRKLNQFNGNFIDAEMVKAFLTSTEYRQRFGSP